ncbi:MAG: peptide chain release factor N(5)-glutamine methyltransferase [Blautia sp.]|nr:peptide chain release factor N(5)-glutamine methyltransferase [Blautia sp.]
MDSLNRQGRILLSDAGIEDAAVDTFLIMEKHLHIDRAYLYAHPEEEVSEKKAEKIREDLLRRASRIPLQHITGETYFFGHRFRVSHDVLIPRQETELLVEEALARLGARDNAYILDMCTGSGCILCSVLAERTMARGVGVDISGAALAVARENTRDLGVAERTVLVQGDLFEGAFFETCEKGCFDMILSNPPYIPTDQIGNLMEEVCSHDPFVALDGGEDGLDFYRRLSRQSRTYLKQEGWFLCEIGHDQAASVSGFLEEAGFSDIMLRKDYSGQDRLLAARWPGADD